MKQITVENKQEIKKTYATSLRRAINSAIRRHSGITQLYIIVEAAGEKIPYVLYKIPDPPTWVIENKEG